MVITALTRNRRGRVPARTPEGLILLGFRRLSTREASAFLRFFYALSQVCLTPASRQLNMDRYRSGYNGPDSKSKTLHVPLSHKNLAFTGFFVGSKTENHVCSLLLFSPFSKVHFGSFSGTRSETYTETYRRGHNENDSKSFDGLKPSVGSNPTVSANFLWKASG